ncbi:MAG TPA: Gfo/Idh/MocA family oxidoreductase [Terriglobales bacterium]|nr:Gfo/Idh/MocA family oxidoreductase [Terriglobales bacterium]
MTNSPLLHAPSRREFLEAGAAVGLAAMAAPRRVLGANDRVRVAVCGVHGRGFDHIRNYAHVPGVEIAAICDVDDNVTRRRVADMEKMGLPRPQTYVDVRKLLEDHSIDAVSVATPNHWHSLIGIWVCQAGKDLYVEKPMSHYAWEGRQLLAAVKKYNRICQHGSQSRSMPPILEGVAQMRKGLIGDVYMARGLCYKWRPTIGRAPVAPVPPGVDYDLWTGPAPKHPFTANRFHYNWHWFWDTGNGDLGNQGIHELDIARWGLGVRYPTKATAVGAKVLFEDDQETPNLLSCTYEFDGPGDKKRILEFEVRGWITNHEAEIGTGAYHGEGVPLVGKATAAAEHPRRRQWTWQNTPMHASANGPVNGPGTIGNIFYGSQGYLGMDGYSGYRSWLGPGADPGPGASGGNELLHFQNFIDCVRSRRAEDIHAPIEEGYLSVLLVHLANASYLTGRTIHYDAASERAIGDEEANRLLHGHYRAPYTVPDEV